MRICACVDARVMDEIDTLQAEVMKTLAHPRRLQILHRLAGGPTGVARLATELGMTQPNTSQHLAVMRAAGVVEAERDGRVVRYRLTDPDVTVACGLMRSVLERRLTRLGQMAANAAPPPSPVTIDIASR
jgi:DNA-binding transcriptional ArsR family regulator